MKKVTFTALLLILAIPFLLRAQDTLPVKKAVSQSVLENEVFAGYGLGSIYNFNIRPTSGPFSSSEYYESTRKNIESFGTVLAGYNRMLSRLLSVGILFSYQNVTYKLHYNYDYEGSPPDEYFDEDIYNGMVFLRLNYVNKSKITVYSGLGLGLGVDFYSQRPLGGETTFSRKLLFAPQLTLMGLRFGRAFGGFMEIGFGTNAILSAGLSYKFRD
jgi:opacity protein-like surface antigen